MSWRGAQRHFARQFPHKPGPGEGEGGSRGRGEGDPNSSPKAAFLRSRQILSVSSTHERTGENCATGGCPSSWGGDWVSWAQLNTPLVAKHVTLQHRFFLP